MLIVKLIENLFLLEKSCSVKRIRSRGEKSIGCITLLIRSRSSYITQCILVPILKSLDVSIMLDVLLRHKREVHILLRNGKSLKLGAITGVFAAANKNLISS